MRLSGRIYGLPSKSVHAIINIKIAKVFTIIAELINKSICWIRFVDIYLDYNKPVKIKLKALLRK